MSARSLVSPEDQRVTFVELFFDLVFVFCVTQVVTLLHGHVDAASAGSALLVFWLVWWAWTQFTWALNAADTDHAWVQLATLIATAVAFFQAVGIPRALSDGALRFAAPYVAVRVIGLLIYYWVARADELQRRAVLIFGLASVGGMAAVIVGALAGRPALYWWWGLAIALDLAAAVVGGRREGWNLHPDHFAERHGLIVIIALGETLIVAASGMAGAPATGATMTVAVLAVALTSGLWWCYFRTTKPLLEHAMAASPGKARSMLARDAYSVMHFPMLCGIVAMAAATEQVLAHPTDPLALDLRAALGLGVVLFLGGSAAAAWRASGRLSVSRLTLPLAAAGVVVAVGAVPWHALAALLAAVVALAVLERG